MGIPGLPAIHLATIAIAARKREPSRTATSRVANATQEISLTSAGSVTLSAVEIYYESYQGTPATYQGYFVTDSTLLNRIWYDGAYTVNQMQIQPNTTAGAWSIQNGLLNIQGGNAALLASGSGWTDYSMSFSTEINSQPAGWVVRGQSPSKNYLLILNADNGTGGTMSVSLSFSPALTSFETSISPAFFFGGGTVKADSYQGYPVQSEGEVDALTQISLLQPGANTLQIQASTSDTGEVTPTTSPLHTHTWSFHFTVAA